MGTDQECTLMSGGENRARQIDRNDGVEGVGNTGELVELLLCGSRIELTLGHVQRCSFKDLCGRSEEHTSELQSLMRISYAVFCLNNNNLPNTPAYRRISPSHS